MQAAQDQLDKLEKAIQHHNANPPPASEPGAVLIYNNEADFYNNWVAQLQGQLNSANAQYTPATTANTVIPSWTQLAPQQPNAPRPPYQGPSTPPMIDEVPLQDNDKQVQRKYKHAPDFGVQEPQGRAGFDKFDAALRQFLHDPSTLHIDGTYGKQPAILNVNPDSGLVVIQSPDGNLISAWKCTPEQLNNILIRGSL